MLDRALQVAHKARIRRYALPARNNAASSSEPSPPERGSDGRYLRGHLPSSPGRPRHITADPNDSITLHNVGLSALHFDANHFLLV